MDNYLKNLRNNKLADLIINTGSNYGNRYGNNGQKQAGYFGELKLPTGDVATEYSIGQNINGRDMEMPSIVPTLDINQLAALLRSASYGTALPSDILQKSAEYAKSRINQGRSPFWAIPEKQYVAPTIENYTTPIDTLDFFRKL